MRLTVETGSSRLLVPRRLPHPDDARISFETAEGAPVTAVEQLTTPHHTWRVIRDLAIDESTLEVVNDDGTIQLPHLDLELQRNALERYSYTGADFTSVRGETLWERGMRRGEWSVRTCTRTILSSTPTSFSIHAQLDAFEGDRRVFARTWNEDIPRDLV